MQSSKNFCCFFKFGFEGLKVIDMLRVKIYEDRIILTERLVWFDRNEEIRKLGSK